MPTIAQIRAARALLDWSQSDLAEFAGLSQTGIARIENGTNKPNSRTLDKINTAFDHADIEFIADTGVKKRKGEIKTLKGKEGFIAFMYDVYITARDKGGLICLHNAEPENWNKWMGKEEYDKHAQRMNEIKTDFEVRITAKQGNTNLIASSFAEYRWIPEHMFNEQSFYAYGDKLAFMIFEQDSVEIKILEKKQFADTFRMLFNLAWDSVTITPNEHTE